jgi:hypothetical protein
LAGVDLLELFELKGVPLNLSMKKVNFSQLDKSSINLSVDKVYNAKNIFWIATLYRKIGRKNTFDFGGLYIAARRGILGKLVVLRYSLALTSIFILKSAFPN